jgi:LrgA family
MNSTLMKRSSREMLAADKALTITSESTKSEKSLTSAISLIWVQPALRHAAETLQGLAGILLAVLYSLGAIGLGAALLFYTFTRCSGLPFLPLEDLSEYTMTNIHEQSRSDAIAVTRILLPGSEETLTPAGAANRRTRRCIWVELPVGFAVLTLSVLAGEQIKIWLHLRIPSNILGLFILLLCFRLRLTEPKFIEKAANRLFFVQATVHVCLASLSSRS